MGKDINFNRWVDLEGLPNRDFLRVRLVYDPNTKVVYMTSNGQNLSNSVSFSPYYVVNEEGKAEIAVLGKNYFAG